MNVIAYNTHFIAFPRPWFHQSEQRAKSFWFQLLYVTNPLSRITVRFMRAICVGAHLVLLFLCAVLCFRGLDPVTRRIRPNLPIACNPVDSAFIFVQHLLLLCLGGHHVFRWDGCRLRFLSNPFVTSHIHLRNIPRPSCARTPLQHSCPPVLRRSKRWI